MRNDDILDEQYIDGNSVHSKHVKYQTLEERAAEFGGKLGSYEEMDFGRPMGRERWSE